MPGEGLSSGDGLGNGLDCGGAEAELDGDVDGTGCGAFVCATAGPPMLDASTAANIAKQAAAIPAALINDYAFLAVFLAMRDF